MSGIEKQVKEAVGGKKATGGKKKSSGGSAEKVAKSAKRLFK